MNIGLIGLGVVGSATNSQIHDAGHATVKFDPARGFNDSMRDCDVVFVSVPVPTLPNGEQDIRVLKNSIMMCGDAAVFIRSSILPGTTQRLRGLMMNPRIYAAPEFLTERQAESDSKRLALVASVAGAEILISIFTSKEIIMLPTEADCEFVKYIHNSFAAMKVGFFNTMHQLAQNEELNYDESVAAACAVTGFIERTHTKVPGPDGQFGFGGKCLLKDLHAMATFVERSSGTTFLRNILNENFYNRFNNFL